MEHMLFLSNHTPCYLYLMAGPDSDKNLLPSTNTPLSDHELLAALSAYTAGAGSPNPTTSHTQPFAIILVVKCPGMRVISTNSFWSLLLSVRCQGRVVELILEKFLQCVTLCVILHWNSDPHFPLTRVCSKTLTAYPFYPQTLIPFLELHMPNPARPPPPVPHPFPATLTEASVIPSQTYSSPCCARDPA